MPAGAVTFVTTEITIRNDTPNPAYVLFDFLTIPNHKVGGWAAANGGTAYATYREYHHFLTHVHVYVKPEGQMSESAPTICYAGASYANSEGGLLGDGGHFKVAIRYDFRHNTCWLENF